MKDKNFSNIRLSMRSHKTTLNECSTEQDQYVSIEIEDNRGRKIIEVDMSLTQFARMISSNNNTTCTIRHAYNNEGFFKDEVAPIKSVVDEYTDEMKDSLDKIDGRMEELEQKLYEMANKKSVSKKDVEQALSEIKTIKTHFNSNQKYYLNEGKKALAKIHDEQRTIVQNLIDLGKISELKIKSKEEMLFLEEGLNPIEDNFERKEIPLKSIDEMTDREVSDELSKLMRIVENTQNKLKLPDDKVRFSGAGSIYTGKQIKLRYISYQGEHAVDKEIVREYLSYLRSLTKKEYETAKTHHFLSKKK